MTENKQIIIDASQCEWRTGVEHCGNYECMLNKCCDYNCDWYKRRKLEQQLVRKTQECKELKEELSHIQHNCTREGCKYYDNEDYKVFYGCKAEQKLEYIKEIANYSFNLSTPELMAKLELILQIIDEVE